MSAGLNGSRGSIVGTAEVLTKLEYLIAYGFDGTAALKQLSCAVCSHAPLTGCDVGFYRHTMTPA